MGVGTGVGVGAGVVGVPDVGVVTGVAEVPGVGVAVGVGVESGALTSKTAIYVTSPVKVKDKEAFVETVSPVGESLIHFTNA